MDAFQLEAVRSDLLAVARAMLAREVGLVEGCRAITRLHWKAADPDRAVFFPFQGVYSEADSWPLPHARRLWNAQALAEADEAMMEYERRRQADIDQACLDLIRQLAQPG